MATKQCSTCKEETGVFLCRGCEKDFCFDHLTEHRQLLNEQLYQIQDDFNQFRQTIIEIRNNPRKHPLIEEIDQWENDSIHKIKQRAEECRQRFINYTNDSINQIEMKLNNSNQQLISNEKKKNDFNEIHLYQLRERLKQLKKEINQPNNVSIQLKSNSFIQQIFIQFSKFLK
jgi:hypothetical protein